MVTAILNQCTEIKLLMRQAQQPTAQCCTEDQLPALSA